LRRVQNRSSRASVFSQPAFEFSPRGEHPPRNRRFRTRQNLRGLGVVQTIVNRQHDGRALFGGKFQQRGLNLLRAVFRRREFSPFACRAENSSAQSVCI
jgi:hypothetical protein